MGFVDKDEDRVRTRTTLDERKKKKVCRTEMYMFFNTEIARKSVYVDTRYLWYLLMSKNLAGERDDPGDTIRQAYRSDSYFAYDRMHLQATSVLRRVGLRIGLVGRFC